MTRPVWINKISLSKTQVSHITNIQILIQKHVFKYCKKQYSLFLMIEIYFQIKKFV